PIAVGWHLHRLLLNRVSQLHLLCLLCYRLDEPIVAGSTDLSRTAQPGYGLFFLADLLVDGAPPLTATCCSSKLRNSFFKKSFSIVNWPIFRSSSASRLSPKTRRRRP